MLQFLSLQRENYSRIGPSPCFLLAMGISLEEVEPGRPCAVLGELWLPSAHPRSSPGVPNSSGSAWRGNLLWETQIHYCCLEALAAPPAPWAVLPFSSQKSNSSFLSQLQSRLSWWHRTNPAVLRAGTQCSVTPLSVWKVLPSVLLIANPRSWQELFHGTK